MYTTTLTTVIEYVPYDVIPCLPPRDPKTVLRARNYGKKRDRMQALKLKAAMKNPDEFYFAMHRKKTEGGVHVLDGAESLPHDVVQV